MKLAKKFGASVYALAPSGKRGAIVVLSEYRQRHHRKFVAKESGRPYSPPQVVDITGAPGMIRTCDPLIRSAITSTASGYGSYDLLTFVTGCSRQGVHLLPPIQTSFAVSLSQVCLNRLG